MSSKVYLFIGDINQLSVFPAYLKGGSVTLLRPNVYIFGTDIAIDEIQTTLNASGANDYIVFEVTDRIYQTSDAPLALDTLF